MLSTDKSRGYCLEMIYADFLGSANFENRNPDTLLFPIPRLFELLPPEQRQSFLEQVRAAV